MAETPGRLVTTAQYDAEIARLQAGRDASKAVIDDPVQRNRRHRRRALLIGLAITKEGSVLPVDFMKKVRSNLGDDADQSLVWREVLEADGWTLTNATWKAPSVEVPVDEPPSKT